MAMKSLPLKPEKVDYLIVHCSATPASRDIGAADIDRMHRLRGFFKIGYHYVIKRDGTIEKGREDNEAGAHAKGYNLRSIGICLVGGITPKLRAEMNFTEEQFVSLKKLLADLKEKFPTATVVGHRDLPDVRKACPCFDVATWMETGKAVF
jgi:N-acetylmuramoyl-L-alanine amidase